DDKGFLVGEYWMQNAQFLHGFVADQSVYLPVDFPDALETQPLDISNTGSIVGSYVDSSGAGHGFVLEQTHYSTFDIPGASSTAAWAINNRGVVVGNYVDSSGFNHGF